MSAGLFRWHGSKKIVDLADDHVVELFRWHSGSYTCVSLERLVTDHLASVLDRVFVELGIESRSCDSQLAAVPIAQRDEIGTADTIKDSKPDVEVGGKEVSGEDARCDLLAYRFKAAPCIAVLGLKRGE